MARTARINAIKFFRCYTIREAAEITGVSTRTICNWNKAGLPVMDDQRPHLIRGDDLRSFIQSKRKERKTETKLHEFFCLRCHDLRFAAGGFAECHIDGNRVRVKALCNVCGTVMNKPVAKARLHKLEGKLELLDSEGEGASKFETPYLETAQNFGKKR